MGRPKIPNSIINSMNQDHLGGMTLNAVAIKYGLKSGTTVLYHFQTRGLKRLPRGGNNKESQAGSENGNWRGGRSRHQGYIRIWRPDHLRADGLGYVKEHILVAEVKLGRELLPGEIVHHINHKRDDNRPENIMVFGSHSEHARFHAQERKNGN